MCIIIRKASDADIVAVSDIYSLIHDSEERGDVSIGWSRSVYPTCDTALQALKRGDLYVMLKNGSVVASAIINHYQDESYRCGEWSVDTPADKVMVLHTLTVNPHYEGKGLGRAFVDFYETYARGCGCTSLRLDTQHINHRAAALYPRLGYRSAGKVTSSFNGLRDVTLLLFEKNVNGYYSELIL